MDRLREQARVGIPLTGASPQQLSVVRLPLSRRRLRIGRKSRPTEEDGRAVRAPSGGLETEICCSPANLQGGMTRRLPIHTNIMIIVIISVIISSYLSFLLLLVMYIVAQCARADVTSFRSVGKR